MEQMRTGLTENRETKLAEELSFLKKNISFFKTSVCMSLKAGQFSLCFQKSHITKSIKPL